MCISIHCVMCYDLVHRNKQLVQLTLQSGDSESLQKQTTKQYDNNERALVKTSNSDKILGKHKAVFLFWSYFNLWNITVASFLHI